MAEPLFFEPLREDLNEIRLLRIDTNEPNGKVRCSLENVSLNGDLNYIALSYTWSNPFGFPHPNPGRLESIVLNGCSFPVQENLETLLRALPAGGLSWYWIDAVCIDQSNDSERSKQVLNMRDIYRGAERVVVWLGPEGDDSNIGLDFIEMMAQMHTENGDAGSNWLIKTASDPEFYTLWRAYLQLFDRTWWRRIWVIQEVSAAKEIEFGVVNAWSLGRS